jgi:hypothetical protein
VNDRKLQFSLLEPERTKKRRKASRS